MFTKIDLESASPKLIADLCLQLHPEASNPVEALDLHIQYLYQHIQLKLNTRIPAADDIELYFVFIFIKNRLMETVTLGELTGE